jgi:uncharacterized repeat protein (TIGR01451 family)
MLTSFLKSAATGLALALLLSFGTVGIAAAQNVTAADTVVTNTITLSFDGANNGGTQTRIDLPATAGMTETFRVARKIDLTLVADQASQELQVLPNQTTATIQFTLTNLGNPNPAGAAQDFFINVTNAGNIGDGTAALTYSATASTTLGEYYVTVGGTAYDVGNPTAVSLASNGTATVQVIANIPSGATDGLADVFTVTAIAVDSGVAVTESRTADLDDLDRVFADAASTTSMTGSTAASPLDVALNGQAVAETRMLVAAPQLSATKTAVVLDEGLGTFDCDAGTGTATPASAPRSPIPGACVEYTITVENDASASADATAVTISDVLPSDVTFAGVSTVAYTGAGAGTASTTTEPANATGTVTVTIGTLPVDTTATFRIRVTVN